MLSKQNAQELPGRQRLQSSIVRVCSCDDACWSYFTLSPRVVRTTSSPLQTDRPVEQSCTARNNNTSATNYGHFDVSFMFCTSQVQHRSPCCSRSLNYTGLTDIRRSDVDKKMRTDGSASHVEILLLGLNNWPYVSPEKRQITINRWPQRYASHTAHYILTFWVMNIRIQNGQSSTNRMNCLCF